MTCGFKVIINILLIFNLMILFPHKKVNLQSYETKRIFFIGF